MKVEVLLRPSNLKAVAESLGLLYSPVEQAAAQP